MRLRIAVFAVFATGMSLVSAQGCATSPPEVAEEDASVAEPVPTADAAKDSTAPVKPDSATTPDSAKPPVDSAVVDVAVRDAADSAPPAPDAGLTARDGEPFDPAAPKPGDPCPPGVAENTVVARRCGKCGNQLALCEAGRIVGTYGACTGEKTAASACLPRERLLADCGFCGKQAKDCDLSCSYVEGACQGEVVGGCKANAVAFIEGVCANPAHVRRQVCSATCTRDPAEPCAPLPLAEIIVSQTAGATVSGEFPVNTTKIGKLTTGACPRTVTTTLTSYQYVRVLNDGPDSVNVTIANVAPSGTTKPDTLATLYPGPDAPADRGQCLGTVNDSPESFTVNIAPGDSVVFHQSLYSATATAANLKTDVKTNFVGPEVAPVPDYIVALDLTMGETVTQPLTFLAGQKTERPSAGVCPVTVTASLTSHRYIRITNDDVVARIVDVSAANGADTVTAVYPGPDAPLSASRGACIGSSNDTCSGAVVGANSCVTNVSVPAGGSVVALVSQYSTTATTATTLSVTTKN